MKPSSMSVSRTRSPSSVMTMRTVPCIAGCDGPKLTFISSVGRASSSPMRWSDIPVPSHERLPLLLRVVLAERVSDELLVHEHPLQVRVPLKADAVHVER